MLIQQFTLTAIQFFRYSFFNAQLAELPGNLHQGPALDQLGPYNVPSLLAVSNQVIVQGQI